MSTQEKTEVGLKFDQPVKVAVSNVVDWTIAENGKLIGAFTIRVQRARMSEAERKQYEARDTYKLD